MSPTSAGVPDLSVLVPDVLARRAPDAARAWTEFGTFVLVDLSGFTALSERLASRGQVGTEELITTVSQVFTALLGASDDGGDVWKFAGDALLIAYQGPEHERRACHAVAAMRRTLARIGRRRLAGLRAELHLSAGVQTGTAHLLLTGTEQLNLIVHGDTIDALLALQNQAAPGQILVGPSTADVLPASWLITEDVVGAALGEPEAMAAPSMPADRARLSDAVLQRYLPRCFVERPDLVECESDHRRAAMAFIQVQGVRAAHDDTAAVAEVEALTRAVEQACVRTGVTLLDTDPSPGGFRYFLTAGAPRATEDAEGRLVTAVAEALRAPSVLTLRAGLTSGQVFAGWVGSARRRTYTAMGDPTNLAARLTARAPAGALLAPEDVLQRVRLDLITESHAPVMLKGKTGRAQVAVVRGVGGVADRDVATGAPLLGRDAEAEQLSALLTAASRGHGGVVEIVGETGIGKTRLATEVVARSGLRAVTVALDEYGAATPFRTVARVMTALLALDGQSARAAAQTVRDLVERDLPDVRPWLSLLTELLGEETPPESVTPQVRDLDRRFRAARTGEVLRQLLAVAVDEPTALILDDSHWTDPASVEILVHVLSASTDLPLATVLTRRPDALGPGGLRGDTHKPGGLRTTVLDLAPLEVDTALALARHEATQPVHPSDLTALVHRAEGNPLFLMELLRGAGESGDALPASVEEVVASRVDRLAVGERDLLRRLAVWGLRVPGALFTALAGDHVALSPLDDFVEVDEDGAVAFRREVYRDVSYAQLSFRRRRTLHAETARVLEEYPDAAGLVGPARLTMLSLHHFRAGAWQRAYVWSVRAAQEAERRHAMEEAAGFWERALASGRRAGLGRDTLRSAHVARGAALFVCGRYDDAARAYVAARHGVSDPREIASLSYELGMVRREDGRFRAALACARRTRDAVRSLPPDEASTWSAQADLLEAGVRYWQGRSADCLRLARRAAGSAAALPRSPERTRLLARAYALHDTAAVELHGVRGEYGDLPLEMFSEIGDLYHYTRFAVNVGYGLFFAGDWDGAVQRWRRSLEVAERIGDLSNVAVNEMNIGELLGYQGRLDEARSMLTRSLDTLVGLGTALPAAHAALFLGEVERLDGNLDAASTLLDRAAELFTAAGRDSGFSLDEWATRRLAVLVDQGARDEAAALAHDLLTKAEVADLHRLRAALSLARLHHAWPGHAAESAEAVDQALRIAEGDVPPYDRALVLLEWGDRAQRAEARGVLAGLGVLVSDD